MPGAGRIPPPINGGTFRNGGSVGVGVQQPGLVVVLQPVRIGGELKDLGIAVSLLEFQVGQATKRPVG